MRKAISLLLLLVIVFNWVGYDLAIALMNAKNNYITQNNIDKGNFNQDHLIEFRVNLDLPYTTDWASFEKATGTVSISGVVYNFVERKYENGYMIYHCLPNHRGTELQNARDYFHSLVYDMEKQDNKESAPKLISVKKLTIETTVTERYALANPIRDISASNSRHIPKAKSDGFGNIPTQPPDA